MVAASRPVAVACSPAVATACSYYSFLRLPDSTVVVPYSAVASSGRPASSAAADVPEQPSTREVAVA